MFFASRNGDLPEELKEQIEDFTERENYIYFIYDENSFILHKMNMCWQLQVNTKWHDEIFTDLEEILEFVKGFKGE